MLGALLVIAFAAGFLVCFLCFFAVVVVEEGSVVAFGFDVAALSAWAKERVAAKADPNIKAVSRFMFLFLLKGPFCFALTSRDAGAH